MSHEPERRLERLRRALDRIRPGLRDDDGRVRVPQTSDAKPGSLASVALVVRPSPVDLELLLIRRATFAGDPWSGHMALPGGRRSSRDATGFDTAVRETREEVGIDLTRAGMPLGRLDAVQPRRGAPPIVVSPYVFAVRAEATTTPNYEVDLALWVPVGVLDDPGTATEYLHALEGGRVLRFPALGYGEHVIWGLTYRILTQFLDIVRTTGAGRKP